MANTDRYHFLKRARVSFVGGLTTDQLTQFGPVSRDIPKDYISVSGEIFDVDGVPLVTAGYAEVVNDSQAAAIVAALAAAALPVPAPPPDILIAKVNGHDVEFEDPRVVGPLTGPAGTRPQRITRLSGTMPPTLVQADGPPPIPAGADDWGNGSPLPVHAQVPIPPVSLIVNAPSTAVHAVSFAVTVQAVDVNGNIVPNYAGTIHFTTSAGASGLADYTFGPGDAGTHTFAAVQFAAAGTAKSIAAADTVTGIHGADTIDIT